MFDRQMWARPLSKYGSPGWRCPRCLRGSLEPIKGTWHDEETQESRANHEDDNWEPDWIEHRWSATFRCSSASCGDVAKVVGVTTHVPTYDD